MDLDLDIESRTIRSILYARKHNGLYSSIVTGARGIGKSSYCIQVLFRVFRTLGFDVDESWQMSLDRVLYTIPEVVDFLDSSSDKEFKDIFVWDDAGVFAGGVRWLTNQREMVLIESICDTMRDCVYGVLFNVPDIRTLSRRIRSYDDNLVKIHRLRFKDQNRFDGNGENVREARFYNKVISPAGQVRVYKKYSDNFDVIIPDWVYSKYIVKRHSYTKSNIKLLRDHLKE